MKGTGRTCDLIKQCFGELKMTTLRSNQETFLKRYSLKFLPEPTPKKPHIKLELTEFWARLKCQSLCKVQLYLVSESVSSQRLTWAIFICTSNCIQLSLHYSTLLNKYEGWNFNSGNYLFTTDTKQIHVSKFYCPSL